MKLVWAKLDYGAPTAAVLALTHHYNKSGCWFRENLKMCAPTLSAGKPGRSAVLGCPELLEMDLLGVKCRMSTVQGLGSVALLRQWTRELSWISRGVTADFALTLAHSLSPDQHQQHFPVCSLGWHQHRGDAGRGVGTPNVWKTMSWRRVKHLGRRWTRVLSSWVQERHQSRGKIRI